MRQSDKAPFKIVMSKVNARSFDIQTLQSSKPKDKEVLLLELFVSDKIKFVYIAEINY